MTLRGMARLSSVLRRRSRRGLSKALAGILLVALLGSSLVEDLEVRALPMEAVRVLETTAAATAEAAAADSRRSSLGHCPWYDV